MIFGDRLPNMRPSLKPSILARISHVRPPSTTTLAGSSRACHGSASGPGFLSPSSDGAVAADKACRANARIRHPLPYYDRSTFLDFAPRPSPSLQFPARKTKPCKADALFLVTDGHWSHHQQPMLRVEVARLERYYTSSFAGFRWKGFAVTLTCKESVGIIQLPFPIAKGLRCS